MNIYGVDAGDRQEAVYEDVEANAGHWEYYRAIHLVAAMSRGQARSIVAYHEKIDFTEPMTITLIAKNIPITEPGIFEDYADEDKYWFIFHRKLNMENLLPIGSKPNMFHLQDEGQLVVVSYGTIFSVQVEVFRCEKCGQEFDASYYEHVGEFLDTEVQSTDE